jgi:hypothetical protein
LAAVLQWNTSCFTILEIMDLDDLIAESPGPADQRPASLELETAVIDAHYISRRAINEHLRGTIWQIAVIVLLVVGLFYSLRTPPAPLPMQQADSPFEQVRPIVAKAVADLEPYSIAEAPKGVCGCASTDRASRGSRNDARRTQ